jgi:hypothetical protein
VGEGGSGSDVAPPGRLLHHWEHGLPGGRQAGYPALRIVTRTLQLPGLLGVTDGRAEE